MKSEIVELKLTTIHYALGRPATVNDPVAPQPTDHLTCIICRVYPCVCPEDREEALKEQERRSHTTIPYADLKSALERVISQWVDEQISIGHPMPNFWDECGTSWRLAAHLVQNGWHK